MEQRQLTVKAILDQIQGLRAEAAEPSALKEQYRLGAAVLAAIRDPKLLRPVSGSFEPGIGQKLLRNELVPAPELMDGAVMLQHDVRRTALRELGSPERMLQALEANKEERTGRIQNQLEKYLKGTAKPLPQQTNEELAATLQVLVWLEGIIGGLPDPQQVRTLTAWRNFMKPFEVLANDNVFQGRTDELRDLRSFVGVLPPATLLDQLRRTVKWGILSPGPALSVYGPGGVGKSALISRFVLEHSRLPDEVRIPFAYLDFDRPTLSVAEPATLVDEMLRQLLLQFPAFEEFSKIQQSFAETAAKASDIASDSGADADSRWWGVESAFSDLLKVIDSRLPSRPYLLVLDTFEQVQYRGERQALSLWRLFGTLQQKFPFLRIVVSGRAPVTTLRLDGELPTNLGVGDLDDESAIAFVMQLGVTSKETAETLVRQVGGVPLSLKLAATLLAKQPEADLKVKSRIWLRTADEVIQGTLFDRILGQIADGELRRLAHPGLVLRRITPELILEVLREPCQLSIRTLDEADDLFKKLRSEVSLVSTDEEEDNALVHRRELREVMLKLLKDRSPALVDDISRRGVDYYSSRSGNRARMERTYHELLLRRLVDKAVFDDSDVRASIQASIAELPLEAQTLLASYGFYVDERILRKATKEQQEAAAAEAIEELLPHGDEGLAEARERLEDYRRVDSDSPIWRARSRVYFESRDKEEAASAVELGLRLAIGAGNSFRVLELLSDKAWQCEQAPWPQEADETLERLSDYAERHNDAAARVQHFLQYPRLFRNSSFDLQDGAATRVVRMFQQLRPRDLFGLMPATRSFWSAAASAGIDGRVFGELIVDRDSTFATTNFESSRAQRTLQGIVRNASRLLNSETASVDWYELAKGLEELAVLWPYRNLHVHPPQSFGSSAA